MMRTTRTSLATIALLLCGLLATGAAPAGTPPTVATDACADPVADDDVVVGDWHDLCELAITATGSADGVTTIDVRLTVASTARRSPTGISIRWDVDGCANRLLFADDNGRNGVLSAVGRDCDDPEAPFDDCINETEVPGVGWVGPCRRGYEVVDVPAPVVEGDTYVWSLEVTPEVAAVIGDHAPGTTMTVRTTVAGPRVYRYGPYGLNLVCVGSWCPNGGDAMASEVDVTVADAAG